jgi:hypothetical protein
VKPAAGGGVGLLPKDVGIITPYRKQWVAALQNCPALLHL